MTAPDLSASPADLRKLPDELLQALAGEVLANYQLDRQMRQILYYEPASRAAAQIHFSKASYIGAGGGNRSSKTTTMLAEAVALATGVFPIKLRDEFMRKFRGPINVRVACESFKTHLQPVILPKLQFWRWSGISEPGGVKGHWGLVPRECLIDGKWDKSYRVSENTLVTLCRDPNNFDTVLGESIFQFMSYDQEPEQYASGSFHLILLDEPPPLRIWRECKARILDVGGRILIAMTWPDDPAIPVDWIYDELYTPGMDGNDKVYDWFELDTRDNVHLDRAIYEKLTARWSEVEQQVKLRGKPIRFASLVHPLFSGTTPLTWCYACHKTCGRSGKHCSCEREETDLTDFSHVQAFGVEPRWPVVWLLDPHPRKPHMFIWVQVTPYDDYRVIAEGEVDDDPTMVRLYTEEIEKELGVEVSLRLMDPNMGASPANAKERGVTWQDEFAEAGLLCELADDGDVGRKRVNEYLVPDARTLEPRLIIHERCTNTIFQLQRYAWADYRLAQDRGQKQTPRDKYDDYPTLLKYLMNRLPSFADLRGSAVVIGRKRRKAPGYG